MHLLSRIVSISLLFVTASPLAAEEGLPVAGAFSGAEGAIPGGWKLNPSFPGKVRIVGQAPGGDGNALELAVGESQKRVGILSTTRLPVRAGEYVYRFKAKGDGEILLGLSLWSGEEWLRLTGNSKPVQGEDWQEYEIVVRVPETASKANSPNEIQSVTDIQPALFVTQGAVQIANLQLTEK